MASGDHSTALAVAPEDLPVGSVVTSSGRVSGVHRIGEPFTDDLPFETMDLVALDVAMTEATRATKVRFNAYVVISVLIRQRVPTHCSRPRPKPSVPS